MNLYQNNWSLLSKFAVISLLTPGWSPIATMYLDLLSSHEESGPLVGVKWWFLMVIKIKERSILRPKTDLNRFRFFPNPFIMQSPRSGGVISKTLFL